MLELFRNLFAPPRHIILLAAAAWIGLTLAEKRDQRYGKIGAEHLNNLAFYGLLGWALGGRLFFILENMPAFLKSPASVFSFNQSLFDPVGGVAAALVTLLIYGQSRNLKLWNTLDALTPIFAALMVGAGLAHFASGASFGTETNLPIGIELWNAKRHPVQIYETLAALLTFGLIWRLNLNYTAGLSFLLFSASVAFWQIILQTFRAERALLFGGVIQGQIIAWGVLALCLIVIEFRVRQEARHG
ncbi:MAG: prolipoprotein diacylglyceryl transferase [Anaerolineales bacterium]